ncbi:PDGLE domain-containing protein [Symbioplanes lichenis]|uniref:PDGLE domain-containing protein n=1 Tax=Symbioplanes lichenis TaxID=1629072 RepID=UPI002738F754|nr:PDGLE domain-containing protein [Actinoplanes lichenis]
MSADDRNAPAGRTAKAHGTARTRLGWFLAGGLLVALLLAGVVSSFASGSPDGLDATAREGCTFNADDEITGGTCMAQQEQDHQLADSPLADYGIKGIDNEYVSTGLAGVLGVLVTFAIGGGVFWLARRRGTTDATTGDGGATVGAGAGAGTGTGGNDQAIRDTPAPGTGSTA